MTDDRPLTLAHAAEHFGLTVAALRAEHARGRLTIYKIGGRYYTTRESVQELDQTWHGRKNFSWAHEGSGIYVIGFDGYVKIGWSDDLASRLRHIQNSLPVKFKVYASFCCAKTNERILLRRFRKYRTRGEWFSHEGEIAEWIKRGCPL